MRKKHIKGDKSYKEINNRLKHMKKAFNSDKKKDIKSAITNAKREIDEIYFTLRPTFDFVIYRYKQINKINELFENIYVVLIAVIASTFYSLIEDGTPLIFSDTKLSNVLAILGALVGKIAIYSLMLILVFLAMVAFIKQISYGKKNDYDSFVQPYELETLHRIIESQTKNTYHNEKVKVRKIQ